MSLQAGALLESRYRIVSQVGHGGTADVFLANDIINKRDVVIKLLREDIASQKMSTLSRFKSEAAILACLNSMNIVQVLGDNVYENRPYIVFEYIKGNTLKDLLDNRGLLSEKEALDYMYQLLSALKCAHSRGIIHRDIKPLNIFVLNDGTLKLADFGIAEVEGIETMNDSNYIMGSVHYIAPELILGKPISEASDIYSCGIVFYEMLTGQVPFDKETPRETARAHVTDPFPSIRKMLPSCSKDLENVLYGCVKKNPNDRYSIDDLLNDISRLKNNIAINPKKKSFFAKLFGAKKW